jgi:XamI restriction endonuclease
LGIECKVSNSAVNSIKRLNHDAVAKTKMWHDDFGNQIVAAAVLSGVYDLANLELAQASGIFLFWAHDLAKLTGWIKTTRP